MSYILRIFFLNVEIKFVGVELSKYCVVLHNLGWCYRMEIVVLTGKSLNSIHFHLSTKKPITNVCGTLHFLHKVKSTIKNIIHFGVLCLLLFFSTWYANWRKKLKQFKKHKHTEWKNITNEPKIEFKYLQIILIYDAEHLNDQKNYYFFLFLLLCTIFCFIWKYV